MSFKEKFSFEDRKKEATRIQGQYPDRVPIIVEKDTRSKNAPDIDRRKFLVPVDLTIGQFLFIIRKRVNLPAEQGLFLFVNNNLMSCSSFISDVYAAQRDIDGFLYFSISGENVYG